MKTLGWVGKRNEIFHVYFYLLVFLDLSGRESFPTFSTFLDELSRRISFVSFAFHFNLFILLGRYLGRSFGIDGLHFDTNCVFGR